MQNTSPTENPPVEGRLGFRFNRAEADTIIRACRHAAMFMQSYGRGRNPIDPLHPLGDLADRPYFEQFAPDPDLPDPSESTPINPDNSR